MRPFRIRGALQRAEELTDNVGEAIETAQLNRNRMPTVRRWGG
jgi:hypothetical protein